MFTIVIGILILQSHRSVYACLGSLTIGLINRSKLQKIHGGNRLKELSCCRKQLCISCRKVPSRGSARVLLRWSMSSLTGTTKSVNRCARENKKISK